MFGRAATTILLLGRQTLVRADFSSGSRPRLRGLWQQERPAIEDLASLVEVTLALGPRPGSRVWVLDSGVWAQAVYPAAPLPPSLSKSEVERALAYEAEPLSGIGAHESAVACVALPPDGSERGWWVVQMRSADLNVLDDMLRRKGSSLAGVGHPAGLPCTLTDAAGSWQRVELWHDVVALVHGEKGKPVEVHLVNADPTHGRWRVEEERWRSRRGTPQRREVLTVGGEILTLGDRGEETWREGKEALEGWLTQWASYLASGAPGLPFIRPSVRPMSGGARAAVAAVLTLISAGACFGHHTLVQRNLEDVRAETKAAQEPARKLADTQKLTKEQETRREQLKQQVERLQRSTEALTVQRKRLAGLLACLADYPHEDVVIQKIDVEPATGDPVIRGVCLKPHLADEFARKLTPALEPLGWRVQAPKHQARNTAAGGGPWSFDLALRTPEPEKPPTPPKKP